MKGESVPKKSESTETELYSYLEKLLDKGSRNGSITEDEIQVALKDVEVSDSQLTTLYSALRNRGVEIVSQGDEDALDVDSDDFGDDDDLDGDSSEDHDIKVAKNADAEMASTKSKKKSRARTTRSRNRARGIDASTVMLTGDPVRMYLKEIGKVDLLTAADEVDLAMKIEAGLEAGNKLEAAENGEIELTRAEMRRLSRVEQVGLEAKQALISANLRLVVSIAKRYVGRGMLFLDLIQEGNLGRSVRSRNSTTRRASSSPRTPPGGSARRSRALSPTRPARSASRSIWSRRSTSSSASQRQLLQDLGRDPTPEEIGAEMDMSAERVRDPEDLPGARLPRDPYRRGRGLPARRLHRGLPGGRSARCRELLDAAGAAHPGARRPRRPRAQGYRAALRSRRRAPAHARGGWARVRRHA